MLPGKTKKSATPQKILVLTPTLTGGSWVCIEDLIAAAVDRFSFRVIGLGPMRGGAPDSVVILRIPYFMFDKLGARLGSNIFFNALYQIPLIFVASFYLLFFRPDVVLSNGFTPILTLAVLARLLGMRVIVYYGSFLKRVIGNRIILGLFRTLNFMVDCVFVNSRGSRDDVASFIDRRKILVVEHWTDFQPFSAAERERLRREVGLDSQLLVLYVGKLSEDKPLDYLLNVIEILGNHEHIRFWFVGSGELSPWVKEAARRFSNVSYLGFVGNVRRLMELYTIADVTWSYADETYLARPAIESLAMGTPIMIPDTPAISEKKGRVRLSEALFPANIGWLVRADNAREIAGLLRDIREGSVSGNLDSVRKACAEYASENYSRKNIEAAIAVIAER